MPIMSKLSHKYLSPSGLNPQAASNIPVIEYRNLPSVFCRSTPSSVRRKRCGRLYVQIHTQTCNGVNSNVNTIHPYHIIEALRVLVRRSHQTPMTFSRQNSCHGHAPQPPNIGLKCQPFKILSFNLNRQAGDAPAQASKRCESLQYNCYSLSNALSPWLPQILVQDMVGIMF